MKMLTRIIAAALLAIVACAQASADESWPDVPLPPKSNTQWIAQSERVNGVPTRVMQFQSSEGRAGIVQYYNSYWSGGYEHKPAVHELPDGTVIGQMHGPYLMTVKVQDSERGTSKGVIAVAEVLGHPINRDPGDLPMMPGAHVISVVESDDPGKHSRLLTLVAPQPPTSVSQFYQSSLANAGWAQVQAINTPRVASAPEGAFVVFSREDTEIQVSIAGVPKGRGSYVVANYVTKDTGSGAR